jgi:hypothetical protein
MSDVVLSYKRDTDFDLANTVRASLTKLGVEVFIDHTSIPSGKDFQEFIAAAIGSTKAVLVLWTPNSVKSLYVRGEAALGLERDILVATAFRGVDPQKLTPPFNIVNTTDLSDCPGEPTTRHPGWRQVLDALGDKLGRPSLASLAATLEAGSEEVEKAKAAFVGAYPNDPRAEQFRQELELVARTRKEFEKQLRTEEERFNRRNNETRVTTRDRVERSREELKMRVAAFLLNGVNFRGRIRKRRSKTAWRHCALVFRI